MHEATLNRLRMFGQPEGSHNKVKKIGSIFVEALELMKHI